MDSASVVGDACVNALNGIALAPVATIAVLGVVPENVPPLADEPPVEAVPASTLVGTPITPEDGVYFTDVVSAFEPAAADADEENEVAAPAPDAPEDPLACI